MTQMALLDYTFLFDPSESWSNLSQFEADLIKFFVDRGMEAETIKTVEGQIGRRILLLKKKEMIGPPSGYTASVTVKSVNLERK